MALTLPLALFFFSLFAAELGFSRVSQVLPVPQQGLQLSFHFPRVWQASSRPLGLMRGQLPELACPNLKLSSLYAA